MWFVFFLCDVFSNNASTGYRTGEQTICVVQKATRAEADQVLHSLSSMQTGYLLYANDASKAYMDSAGDVSLTPLVQSEKP